MTNELTILPIIVNHVTNIGGTDANGRPSPFICCMLRLLEIEPSEEILTMYSSQLGYNRFKYLTSLVMIYYRLTKLPVEVYRSLEPFFKDYRKLKLQLKVPEFDNGIARHFSEYTIDQWADELLQKERVVDIILPRLPPRHLLLQKGELEPRAYYIDEEGNDEDDNDKDEDNDENNSEKNNDSFESDSE